MALEYVRRASAIYRGRAARTGSWRRAGGLKEQQKFRYVFLQHLLATIESPTDDPSARDALTAEGFEAGQLASATSTAAAVSLMAARFAAGDDALAGLVRERQDATERWRKLDGTMVQAVSQLPGERDKAGEAAVRQELSALDDKIKEIDTHLTTVFPRFAELSSPQPIPLVETQALLAEDEVLLTYLVWVDRIFVYAVRRDRVLVRQIMLGLKELGEAVTALRANLGTLTGRGLSVVTHEVSLPARPFDVAAAHKLYSALIAPVEPLLNGVGHVIVVPDGPLVSLPLGLLVTAEPTQLITKDSDYRNVSWLAKRYAISVLPSVGSLKHLKKFDAPQDAKQPFVGFGDPLLDGAEGDLNEARLARLLQRGTVAEVNEVRSLPRLPDTAVELESIAASLKSGPDSIYLRQEATETRVRSMDLSRYRVVAFATHGLMAGSFKGLGEPALVLTPPELGSEADDGLLTASEITQLKLDADWVILSACNTAGPDGTPGAEGFSGLAKAFFYAGSRSLLVSHWPVVSEAAVKLTTRMFDELAKNPSIRRAEALRRSMVTLMEDEDAKYAHPVFWAPFSVVGEGGRVSID